MKGTDNYEKTSSCTLVVQSAMSADQDGAVAPTGQNPMAGFENYSITNSQLLVKNLRICPHRTLHQP